MVLWVRHGHCLQGCYGAVGHVSYRRLCILQGPASGGLQTARSDCVTGRGQATTESLSQELHAGVHETSPKACTACMYSKLG